MDSGQVAPSFLRLSGTTFANLAFNLSFAGTGQTAAIQGPFDIRIRISPNWITEGSIRIPFDVQGDRFSCPRRETGGDDTRMLVFFLTRFSTEP